MSTQERTDDPGEHGYGSAGQDSNIEDAQKATDDPAGRPDKAADTETDDDRAREDAVPDHRT